jgi:hypothetical protein
VFYGNRRDTALKRTDSVAFMERTVVIPRMAPVTNMFRFPSWLTDRSRLGPAQASRRRASFLTRSALPRRGLARERPALNHTRKPI